MEGVRTEVLWRTVSYDREGLRRLAMKLDKWLASEGGLEQGENIIARKKVRGGQISLDFGTLSRSNGELWL
jgi:hypothetical protein